MIRLALIGCLDDTARMTRLAARLRGARFTAVVDADPQIAKNMASALGAPHWSHNFDKLLTDHGADFEAVVVRMTTILDTWIYGRAAAAGKHILADAPLARSSTVASAIITACANAKVRLMVGNPCRFLPSLRAVKETLDSGKLGEPGLLRIHRWEPAKPPFGDPLLQLTNEIDVASWLFGQRPSDVYATGKTNYVQLHFGFPGGGMAIIDYARTLPSGADAYTSLSLIGSTGAAYADEHHNMQLMFGHGPTTALPTPQGDGNLLVMLQGFVNALTENREPSVTGTDGLTALQVAEAAAQSLASGRVVNLGL